MTATTIRRLAPRLLIALAAGAALAAFSSGHSSAVSRARLERSLPQTFANLYIEQAKLLGHQDITVQSLHAHAACDKGGPKVPDHGPGADWTCLMSWNDPNVPLPDGTGKFELNVHSNNCYTASSPTKLVGLLTITDTHGDDVPNPVFEFDGCFDPHSSNARIAPQGTPATLKLPSGQITADKTGHVAPQFTCSAGAPGGCAGILTARIASTTIGTVRYALAPDGKNTFPFALSAGQNRAGTMLRLTVTPLVGTAPRRFTQLPLGSR